MKKCAFWITHGHERFYHEAINSATELAEHMPDVDRFLFATREREHKIFTRTAVLPRPIEKYWYLDSVKYFNQAYELLEDYDQMLYLDADTNILAPFPELFEMAERFDVVGVHGSRRITGAVAGDIPLAFPEFEIGVTIFARNKQVRALLELWRVLHHEFPDIYGNNDQRSFREAMWNRLPKGLKIGTAPTEYGCRWPFGTFVSLPVKILHGRPDGPSHPDSPTIEDVKRIINEHLDMRVWSPRNPRWAEGVIPPDYEGK
jgi:hypothetical protein